MSELVAELRPLLAETFPAADDAPLALAVLHRLAEGRTVSPAALAHELGRDEAATRQQLAAWPNVEYDGDGDVVAFAGLTLRETAHRLTLNGRQLHTWCAWDTLFLPALLAAPAAVRSTCPMSGTVVELRVGPDGIDEACPADLFVSFPPLKTSNPGDITSSFCCHVHFLAGAWAADAWLAANPEGRTVALAAAFELGAHAVAPLTDAVGTGAGS